MEQYGIEETKDVVRLGASLATAINKSLENGKWDWTDATNFIDPAMKVPAAVDGIDQVDEELLDLDDEEQAVLEQMVQDEFDIPSEKAKEIVVKSFKVGIALIRLYQSIKAPSNDDVVAVGD